MYLRIPLVGVQTDPTNLRMEYGHYLASTFPVLGEGCNMFAELVDKMPGGRPKIKVYGGGELVPALEALIRSCRYCRDWEWAAYYWAGKSLLRSFCDGPIWDECPADERLAD